MNAQKRKLMIAFAEVFKRGRAMGRAEEKLSELFGADWPNEPMRKKLEQAVSARLGEDAAWWDQMLSDEEDIL